MNNYSQASLSKLRTCHIDLQIIFEEVEKIFDNTIIYGNRPVSEQLELFKIGRMQVNGEWIVVDKKKVVTNIDGVSVKGKHNYSPSMAVDSIPYPIDWNDTDRIRYFAGVVMGVADKLKAEGKITHQLRWGGDWDGDTDLKDQTLNDLVHFELI